MLPKSEKNSQHKKLVGWGGMGTQSITWSVIWHSKERLCYLHLKAFRAEGGSEWDDLLETAPKRTDDFTALDDGNSWTKTLNNYK